MKEHLARLNEEQRNAVETLEGPLLVLAGAGSGKTRVVTIRIAHLIESGIPASQILGLTFTNKAADEMRERVENLTRSHVLVCTFHSLGARILRESIHALGYKRDFTIYDEEDALKLLRACLQELHIEDKKLEPKAFRNIISQAKSQLKGPHEVDLKTVPSEMYDTFPRVYELYQKRLEEYNAVDFDDLLYLTVKLFKAHPDILEMYRNRWKFLLIDEYQDTNQAQYELTCLLVGASRNLCVVGDPDQSIYSWRGANIKNILSFEHDFPGAKVVRLERNYRSREIILSAANALIGYNTNRYEKNLWSDLGPGEKIKHYTANTEREEAAFVAEQVYDFHTKHNILLKDMVVFYRTNAQSRAFEDLLIHNKIPFVIVGGISFYQRKEIKDVLAFLRMVYSGSDFLSFSRTINLPKRGFGQVTVEKIREIASHEGLSILEMCAALLEGKFQSAGIKLTPKQKKGLQEYTGIIAELKRVADACSLKELVESTLTLTQYVDCLKEDPETFDDRKSNLDELIAKAIEWEASQEEPTLGAFLEELSLKSSLDEATTEADRVNLMTIHNGKGLEFTLVFLVGMEEDLFPHANTRGNPAALEEERRLCYVGVTRAKEYLFITDARMRFLWGTTRIQRPSRFLRELPLQYVEKIRSAWR